MRRHRTIISTTVLLLALLCAAAPGALANPLLSGYGGPGAGSQAMIGATLLNGPGGGGRGGGASSSGEGRLNLAAPTASSASTGASSTTHGGARSTSGSSRARGAAGSSGSSASAARRGVQAQSASQAGFASYPRTERVVGEPASFVAGVSGSDVAYVLVALACLLLTAFATLRLAKRTARTRVER